MRTGQRLHFLLQPKASVNGYTENGNEAAVKCALTTDY